MGAKETGVTIGANSALNRQRSADFVEAVFKVGTALNSDCIFTQQIHFSSQTLHLIFAHKSKSEQEQLSNIIAMVKAVREVLSPKYAAEFENRCIPAHWKAQLVDLGVIANGN